MTNSLKLLQKPISKDSSKFNLFNSDPLQEEVLGSDLFFQLTYMQAVASAGVSRSRIFLLGASLKRQTATFFARIHLLAQKLGYDYSRACSLVGLGVKSETMISLLLRLSTALQSGQPERDFLDEEAGIQGSAYEKEYERDLASLTKWTDAYAAVTISASLIIIINMTSSLIYPLGDGMVVGLVFTAAFISGLSAWVLSRAAPKEVIEVFSDDGPWSQRRANKLAIPTLAAVFIICPLLVLLHISMGWLVMVAAFILLPLGIISMLAGREIDKKDREFGPFLRSLGGMAVSTGTTITEALTRLDLSSFPNLESDLTRLRSRLAAAMEPEICWYKFADETGSKLIGETVSIFYDAVKLGGEPDIIGLLAADFSARTIMLRAKRKVTAASFTWLTVIMHGTVASLLVVVLEIVHNFVLLLEEAAGDVTGEAVASFSMSMPAFNTPQVGLFRLITVLMVLAMSMINAYAIGATDGGHKLKMTFYLSLMLILSAICMIILPPAIAGFLIQESP